MESKEFDRILAAALQIGTSDIHIKIGAPIMVREDDSLVPGTERPMTSADVTAIALRILSDSGSSVARRYIDKIDDLSDLDASLSVQGVGRFRVNIARQRGSLTLSLRVIPAQAPTIDDLNLPPVLKEIALLPRGLILVTGTTGSGKSTTLAAMLHHINTTVQRKIITIEDPIEFLLQDDQSFIIQRDVGEDTKSFAAALRAALRQDPDVIMVGELRDRETVEIAIKSAETGHSVLSTVHTGTAEGTILRILGVFEPAEQPAVRARLCDILQAVISQRLIVRDDRPGRVAAMEVMRMTTAIRDRISSADTKGFTDLIEQGWNPYQMHTFDQHLTKLYQQQIISFETGMAAASSPTNFKRNLMFEGS
jgi:twitching motility protein PilT